MGYSEILAPPPKKYYVGQLRIIQGEHLKIRGDLEKFEYEGAYKISWGFEKIEGARLSGGLLQRGALKNLQNSTKTRNKMLENKFKTQILRAS